MNYAINFLLGFVGSLAASLIFLLYVLHRFRPNIEISPFISRGKDYDDNSIVVYRFKFINKSKYEGFDVRMEINQLSKIPCGNGQMNTRRKALDLKKDFISHLAPYKKSKDGEIFGRFAQVFTCMEDIEPILKNENKSVEIQITLRHGLTGLGKVFKKEFADFNVVHDLNFAFGEDLTTK